MKKFLLIAVAMLFAGKAMAEDQPIDYNQVPQTAKTFITTHFANVKVMAATKDPEFLDTEYTVYLENGSKVEFNGKGAWKKVDCGMNPVPATVIPTRIATYVTTTYPDAKITQIDKDKTDYELELSNKVELKFDLQGNLIGMDN